MAPIHDTDIAEDRWTKDEWRYYEFWEKVELQLKRRKKLWIVATVVVFGLLSAVPVLLQRWPKWTTLTAARELAFEISRMKRDAAIEHRSFRIEFEPNGSLHYKIIALTDCADASGKVVRTGTLIKDAPESEYVLVNKEMAEKFSIPGVIHSYCYDPLVGGKLPDQISLASEKEIDTVGFGIAPVKDLSSESLERVSFVFIKGSLAEISFN